MFTCTNPIRQLIHGPTYFNYSEKFIVYLESSYVEYSTYLSIKRASGFLQICKLFAYVCLSIVLPPLVRIKSTHSYSDVEPFILIM
jgi:hypothetical protein